MIRRQLYTVPERLSFLQHPSHSGGRKVVPMFRFTQSSKSSPAGRSVDPIAADSVPTDPRPAEPRPADRLSQVLDAVARLAEQQRAVLEALQSGGVAPGSVVPGGVVATSASAVPAASAGVTADAVRALVAEQLNRHHTLVARQGYAREHLSDLPEAYRRLLPETADVSALASAEQEIRRQFRDDLRAVRRSAGEPAVDQVAGQALGGESPAAAVDFARLSPLSQIELGLRASSLRAPAARPGATGRRDAVSSSVDTADTEAEEDPHDQLFVGAD